MVENITFHKSKIEKLLQKQKEEYLNNIILGNMGTVRNVLKIIRLEKELELINDLLVESVEG